MGVYLFTKLFYLLLLFFMCSVFGVQVCANSGEQGPAPVNTIDLFTKIKIAGAKGPEGNKDAKEVEVNNYYCPVLLSAGDYIVALAGIDRIDKEKKINIVTRYVENNKLLKDEDSVNPESSWETQFAAQHEIQEIQSDKKIVKGLLAVAKENTIYVLRVNYSTTTDDAPNIDDLAFKLVVGDVKKKPEKIVWEERPLTVNNVAKNLKTEFNGGQESDFLFAGSAFLPDEEKIVFALIAKEKQKKPKISALTELKNNKEIKSKLVDKNFFEGCYPYFFPWNKKL